jgi:hypothetical protein
MEQQLSFAPAKYAQKRRLHDKGKFLAKMNQVVTRP